jgi:hypothetical protein
MIGVPNIRLIITQNKYMYTFQHKISQKRDPLASSPKNNQTTNYNQEQLEQLELLFAPVRHCFKSLIITPFV